MTFAKLSSYFQKLEKTTLRNAMMEILAQIYTQATPQEAQEIAYLCQGRVVPLFVPLEFGMADKMVIKTIALAFAVSQKEVEKIFKKEGDLGVAAEQLRAKHKAQEVKLRVSEVYRQLYKVTQATGEGSVEQKIGILAAILARVDPLSVRYLARIPLGKLRLGFSDMTVLDALSWLLTRSKSIRPEIEKAYNVRPDLGFIAKTVKEKGLQGLTGVTPLVGTPILMARAERLSSAQEIIEKIGRCAVEPKIDGFRLQCHFLAGHGKSVKLYTRNLEEATFMYPDVVEGVKKQIRTRQVIFEGEAVAYNPQTGEYLPFQETAQRKRKYEIGKKAQEIPLKLICFDLLYLNGKNFIPQTYEARRKNLEKIVGPGERLLLSEEKIVDSPADLEKIFQDAVSRGLEGVMAKRLEGIYQAGARGWNWIKYKRSSSGKLEDTIDAVVMGYDFGQGKRASFGIGDFLIGIYDQTKDMFVTMAKIGTGLTDEEWRRMKKECAEIRTKLKPARYDIDKLMTCDVWVEPQKVVVIQADEITRSPVHTAGRLLRRSKTGEAWEVEIPGFALRFPRLVEFRSDKLPEDTTTLKEIEEMFKAQGRVKAGKKGE